MKKNNIVLILNILSNIVITSNYINSSIKKITPNQADWVKQIMANTQHAKSNVPFFYYMQIVFAKYIIT